MARGRGGRTELTADRRLIIIGRANNVDDCAMASVCVCVCVSVCLIGLTALSYSLICLRVISRRHRAGTWLVRNYTNVSGIR